MIKKDLIASDTQIEKHQITGKELTLFTNTI